MASQTLAAPKGPRHHTQPLVWRWLPLRLALAVIPLWLTTSILVFNVDRPTKLLVAVVFGVSLAAPGRGLLLAAALAPLGHLIAPLIGPFNFRISEAVIVAFLAGWILRGLPDRPGPRVALPAIGWLFAAVIAASVTGLAWQLRPYPGVVAATVDRLLHAYYLTAGDVIGFVDAARLLEGLALVAATVMLFRRQPRLAETLPAVLVASASAAALASVLLWRGIGSAFALRESARIGYRVSAHVTDVNAAGSYFAMMLCLALGMAARASGRNRMLWLAGAVATSAGLWLSGSRSAFAALAVVVSLAVGWAATMRWPARVRAGALLALLALVLAGGYARARFLERDPDYHGVGFRNQFNETSLRMIAARPAFGVGIGQYYPMSAFFLSPELAFTYGVENAHNYFLQIGGELGLAGLALLVIWLGSAVAQAARAAANTPRDWRLLGAAGGVAALCGTCLSGHPLLVDEVMAPFWILFGLTIALAGAALLSASIDARGTAVPVRRSHWVPAAAIAAAAVWGVADALQRPLAPPASASVDGFYEWDTADDGARFRWTGHYASLFVPENVVALHVPVRVPATVRDVTPVGIETRSAGLDLGRAAVGAGWTVIDIPLTQVPASAHFKRVTFRVDNTWRPALYIPGSRELRTVGVQVGEPRLDR